MMGETSYYNPATVLARKKNAEGAFGRIFYAEGDYVHEVGFYNAYQYSGGENWRSTTSYPPCSTPPTPWAGCSEQPAVTLSASAASGSGISAATASSTAR